MRLNPSGRAPPKESGRAPEKLAFRPNAVASHPRSFRGYYSQYREHTHAIVQLDENVHLENTDTSSEIDDDDLDDRNLCPICLESLDVEPQFPPVHNSLAQTKLAPYHFHLSQGFEADKANGKAGVDAIRLIHLFCPLAKGF